jgi:integrase
LIAFKGANMGYIRETKLKKGGTRFQAEVRLKGHPPLTAIFDRKTDAKTWIQKVESDIRAGRHHLYSKGKKHTFKDAVERYFEEQKISQAKRGHLLWWQSELGALYLQDVRPSIITERKQKLLTTENEKSKKRSKSTCNRYLASLSHLLSVCTRQWEWISENPVKKIAREKEPRERTRFLSPEERSRLLEACKKSENPLLTLFVVLLLSTGCRYNEIRHLKWTDLDLFKGKITLTQTKNGEVRSVPLRGLGLDLLRKFASECNSIGYVFALKDPTKPIDPRRSLKTAIRNAGLKNLRPHDFRHSYASELLAQGLSLGEIGHLLGHRSVSMTRRYAHLVESRATDAVAKMSEQIFSEVENG